MDLKKTSGVADVNPFFFYIIGFSIALIIYLLDWSYLFPPLSFSYVTFLIVTFIISGAIGFYIHKKGLLKYRQFSNKLNINWLVAAITVGYALNFLYARQIPLFSIANNQDI